MHPARPHRGFVEVALDHPGVAGNVGGQVGGLQQVRVHQRVAILHVHDLQPGVRETDRAVELSPHIDERADDHAAAVDDGIERRVGRVDRTLARAQE